MVFVVGEALVNLCAGNVGKTVRHGIDRLAVLQKADNVVNADTCPFDPRGSAADSLRLHDIAIVRRGFHNTNYITGSRKIDILTCRARSFFELTFVLRAVKARVIGEGKVRTYDTSGRRGDADSTHHGRQAVARAAKTPHSTW